MNKSGRSKDRRNQQAETGRNGEQTATDYLLQKGYEIRNRNYRYRHSEIDIIAQKDNLLVFVEVKAKRNISYGYPEEAVNEHKIQKIIEGADQYIFETDWQHKIRFDIIAINLLTGEIMHFEDAFY